MVESDCDTTCWPSPVTKIEECTYYLRHGPHPRSQILRVIPRCPLPPGTAARSSGSHSILGNSGENPLSSAAWGGYQVVVELVLTNRDTALMSDTAYGRYPVVCLLGYCE